MPVTNRSYDTQPLKVLLVTSEDPDKPVGGLGTSGAEFAAHLRGRTDIDLRVILITNGTANEEAPEPEWSAAVDSWPRVLEYFQMGAEGDY